MKLLVANRGEIAIRIMRSATEHGWKTLAVYSDDDADSLHVAKGDASIRLSGTGVAAYLDMDTLLKIASAEQCDAIHPGYGFLSESAEFARACEASDIKFVGPDPGVLELLGDKANARELALAHNVPVLDGSRGKVDIDGVRKFFLSNNAEPIVIKAIAGGGGRGIRVIRNLDEIEEAFNRCQSEALSAFGNADLYVETYVENARHIEVQVIGDGERVIHLGERDCSIQRRHQKLVEIAPAPFLDDEIRQKIHESALKMAGAIGYQSLGTFEFLVFGTDRPGPQKFVFIEANPRLQVEHTVTEEVMDIDLVGVQLKLVEGVTLKDMKLPRPHNPTGFSIQLRINMEAMQADGSVIPAGGVLDIFAPPAGPGVRVDSLGYAGYQTNPRFDSLLAKLIVTRKNASFAELLQRAYRAVCEFQIEGISTNLLFMKNLLTHPAFTAGGYSTGFVDEHIAELLAPGTHQQFYFAAGKLNTAVLAGAQIDKNNPLAVLNYGLERRASSTDVQATDDATFKAPMQGTIIEISVANGDTVSKGTTLVIMDSMKMEHEIKAMHSGVIDNIHVQVGDTLFEGYPLLSMSELDSGEDQGTLEIEVDLDEIRPDLLEVVVRRQTTLDENRPNAVARRRKTNQRTARENIMDLCDEGSFVEYGQLVVAAQRRRRSLEELIDKSPADGMVTGVGAINGDLFDDPDCRSVVMSYDYTVFAGTQGGQNHRKTDRMIGVAEKGKMPMVLFAEGGGGRPGDTDGVGGETSVTFARFATLSGLVPMVGITSGRCFAGNASLLGCCDVIIATANANIGMGGPAMIEGGGLGIFTPEEIGPMSVQVPNGVVDILVRDEAQAVQMTRKYLSYFQGRIKEWQAPDQRLMRSIIPENRLRVYDVRRVIETLADVGSVLEIRPQFGLGMITSLIRLEGIPVGIIANNPMHLGGAIDADGSDKGARFMQLCDAFDIPIIHLCDTPGIMVGPEVEKTALVRHSSRMFLTGANLSVPFFTIILRKAYGLGAIAMAGGSYKKPLFTVAWPTGEFGGMGLEGSVKLGYRNELAAIEDPQERLAKYEEMVARAYENGKALNYASLYSVDDTIDPADSRRWATNILKSLRLPPPSLTKKRPAVDAW